MKQERRGKQRGEGRGKIKDRGSGGVLAHPDTYRTSGELRGGGVYKDTKKE